MIELAAGGASNTEKEILAKRLSEIDAHLDEVQALAFDYLVAASDFNQAREVYKKIVESVSAARAVISDERKADA